MLIKCPICGKENQTSRRFQNNKYCSRKCFKIGFGKHMLNNKYAFEKTIGKNNGNWKGGIYIKGGYYWVSTHYHPRGIRNKLCWIIAEQCLGRYLQKGENIHHINGDKLDDRPENLYLFSSNKEHTYYHGLKVKPVIQSNLMSDKVKNILNR